MVHFRGYIFGHVISKQRADWASGKANREIGWPARARYYRKLKYSDSAYFHFDRHCSRWLHRTSVVARYYRETRILPPRPAMHRVTPRWPRSSFSPAIEKLPRRVRRVAELADFTDYWRHGSVAFIPRRFDCVESIRCNNISGACGALYCSIKTYFLIKKFHAIRH